MLLIYINAKDFSADFSGILLAFNGKGPGFCRFL
jgi:hypothetical protein